MSIVMKIIRSTNHFSNNVTIIFQVLIYLLQSSSILSHCPNMCSHRGICNSKGQCECSKGFRGGDCSLRVCPSGISFSDYAYAKDSAHQGEECSGRGHCDQESGLCKCADGFTGKACERTSCRNNCNNRGICTSMRQLAGNELSIDSKRFIYDTNWDADKIFGCLCDLGYSGFDCSQRVCPSGDDPLTTEGVQEIQLVRCTAHQGELVLYFQGYPSGPILSSASSSSLKNALEQIPLIGKVKVDYSEGNEFCRSDVKNIVTVKFMDNFGPLPPLVADNMVNMNEGSFIEIGANNPTKKMTDDYGNEYFAVKGTKENEECSNRGICDEGTGTCNCFENGSDKYAGSDGYGNSGSRGDCGFAVNVISSCPNSCNNRGICDMDTKRCICEKNYIGGDCSLRQCEHGWSWFSYPTEPNKAHNKWVECSNMGICHRSSGLCECNDGYFGSACEYMTCDSGDSLQCSGHGMCLSMRHLSLYRKQILIAPNGDEVIVASPEIYGSDPNNANTWDADRIHGCHCDDGYEGYDCSFGSCPKGIDILDDNEPPGQMKFVCSNHGVCNHDTGKCRCFDGWGSSNGNGTSGSIDDCGHRIAMPYRGSLY